MIGLFTLILPCLYSCSSEDELLAIEELPEDCIWAASPHCAFTDIIEYHNKIYCCFREGQGHIPSGYNDLGGIRILESTDGISWEPFPLITDAEYDLRDPSLSVTPDGRLMLLYGRYSLDPESCHTWTYMKIISEKEILERNINEKNFSPTSIEDDDVLSNYWIWRIKWKNDRAFGIAYKNGKYPLLVMTTDGINYSVVSVLNVMGNEADIEFVDDDKMVIVMRGQSGNGYLGYADLNKLKNWSWTYLNNWLHSPSMIKIDENIIVAGRAKDGTTLFIVDKKEIHPLVIFDCQGEYAYPGMTIRNDCLFVSYYAEIYGHTVIFVKKINLEDLRKSITAVKSEY